MLSWKSTILTFLLEFHDKFGPRPSSYHAPMLSFSVIRGSNTSPATSLTNCTGMKRRSTVSDRGIMVHQLLVKHPTVSFVKTDTRHSQCLSIFHFCHEFNQYFNCSVLANAKLHKY